MLNTFIIRNYLRITDPYIQHRRMTYPPERGVRVRVDFAGYDKNGRLQLFEVKNGPYARPTPNQSIVLPKLQQGKPFVPYGRNATYLNLILRVPYTSDYGFNYIHYK